MGRGCLARDLPPCLFIEQPPSPPLLIKQGLSARGRGAAYKEGRGEGTFREDNASRFISN